MTKKTENTGMTGQEDNNDKLLELVQKLSSQVESFQKKFEDQEQQIKDLQDQKTVPTGMAELLKELKANNTAEVVNPLRYYRPEEIDLNDVLKDPVVFYAYGTGYAIADDKRNGKPQLTPFGNTIFFAHQATQKVKVDGKNTQLYSYSTYPSYSKKESQWLREHSRFGIHFFETAKEAMDTNSDIAARITKHLSSLNRLEPGQIVAVYQNKKLPNTTDINRMKNTLALEAVKEEIQNERSNQEKYFSDIFDKNLQTKATIVS